jgi:hypothetical protein
MSGCLEYDNEPYGTVRSRKFLDDLRGADFCKTNTIMLHRYLYACMHVDLSGVMGALL